jgi:hypothetical protein
MNIAGNQTQGSDPKANVWRHVFCLFCVYMYVHMTRRPILNASMNIAGNQTPANQGDDAKANQGGVPQTHQVSDSQAKEGSNLQTKQDSDAQAKQGGDSKANQSSDPSLAHTDTAGSVTINITAIPAAAAAANQINGHGLAHTDTKGSVTITAVPAAAYMCAWLICIHIQALHASWYLNLCMCTYIHIRHLLQGLFLSRLFLLPLLLQISKQVSYDIHRTMVTEWKT